MIINGKVYNSPFRTSNLSLIYSFLVVKKEILAIDKCQSAIQDETHADLYIKHTMLNILTKVQSFSEHL